MLETVYILVHLTTTMRRHQRPYFISDENTHSKMVKCLTHSVLISNSVAYLQVLAITIPTLAWPFAPSCIYHTNLRKQGIFMFPLSRWENQHLVPLPFQRSPWEKTAAEFSSGQPGSVLSEAWQVQAQGRCFCCVWGCSYFPLFSNLLSALGVWSHTGAKVRPLHWIVALLLERLVIKVMLPYFLFPHAIVWLRMAFLTMFWQQPTPGPVPRRFRFCLSSGLLFKRVPSFSRPFYPLPCTEVLLLWTELMKRSDSGQHSAPRTRVSRDSQGTTVTMHHRALRRGPLKSSCIAELSLWLWNKN